MTTTGSVLKRDVVADEFEWKIENFSLNEWRYRSPEFKFQSETWLFWVFPSTDDEYILLGIVRIAPCSPTAVEFTLALKTSDGHKSCERGGTEFLDQWKYGVIYRMISRKEFERPQPELLSSGCLTFIITMKRDDFLEPAGRRRLFRSRYIPVNSSASVSDETLPVATASDSVKSENASGEFEWKIENFSLAEDGHVSPEFTLESERWKFTEISKLGSGYISLCVIRMSSGSPILVEFTFALQTSDGQKIFERVETEIFHEWKCSCDYRSMEISEFENRQSEFLSSGCLTVVVTVKIVEAATASAIDVCSCCKENLNGDKTAVHKKCLDRSVKCPRCDEAVRLRNWSDHKCQMATAKASTSTQGSSVVCNHGKFHQDFKQLLLNRENSDVILKVKGVEFPGHKAVLAARSPVLASTFRNEMKEKKTGVVDIVDCDPIAFQIFLCFLYTNETDSLSEENIFALFKIADKYESLDLRAICLDFMQDNLSVETFCEALTISLQYGESELLRVVTDFFTKNAKKILVTVSWQTFATENPIQSNELVIKLVASYESSSHGP